MSTLRFLLRATVLVLWIAVGLLVALLFFPVIGQATRRWFVLRMSRLLMHICGVKVHITGSAPVLERPILYVSNHISWLDIFVLNSVRCTSFIAKSEIRNWPVVGWLVAAAGTIFIERGQRHAVKTVGTQMTACFARGDAVGLFPEGTTSTGMDVRNFHSSLFEAALGLDIDIQPVALRFFQRGQRTERFAFVGDQSLVHNIWVLLSARDVTVESHFLSPLTAHQCKEWGRSLTAQHTREQILAVIVDQQASPS